MRLYPALHPFTARIVVAIGVALAAIACVRTPASDAGTIGPQTAAAPVAKDVRTALPAPLPESPAPEVIPQKPERRPGAWANLDAEDDDIVGPPDAIDDCEGTLARAGVRFLKATLAVHDERFKRTSVTCGAPQVITYLNGPGKIAYNTPPLLTCAMAAALATFERIAQDEATAALKSPIVRIDHLGTYNCREMAAYPGWVSEHGYANAIDVARFVLKDGRTIVIERDFDLGDGEPSKAPGLFLRRLSRRANDEDVFSHVLTPFFDALHRNHFHLDLSRYRRDGTRPRS